MRSGPVLVVDDDAVSRQELVQALTHAEMAHVAIPRRDAALAGVVAHTPSIILLNLGASLSDGYALVRELRSDGRTRDIPVVVLTGRDDEEAVVRAFDAGADDVVRKPFRSPELIARIRGQLRLRGVVGELEKREKDSQLVLEITQALASSLDFRGILFTVVQRIAEVAKVDRVSIVLVQGQGDVGFVVAASDDEQLRDLAIDLSKYPEIRQVLSSHQPLVIPDASKHPLLEIMRAEVGAPTFTSLAILPILYEQRPMGVLFLRSKHAFVFDQEDVALCQTVSNAMAIALRNARILQTLRDQTQQVAVARFEAERRLQTLQKYADFFESGADGIVVIDNEGHLLFSNPRAHEMTGYSGDELRGRRIGELFAEDDSARARELRQGFAKGRFPQGVDVRLRRKDGRIMTLSVNFNSVMREEGAVVCSFRDVTAERAVEGELLKTKEFLQRVINSSVDAIISADIKGRVLLVNRAAERVYGRTASEMLGMDVRKLYPSDGAVRVMRLIRQSGGRIEGHRTEILDADQEVVPVSLSAALLFEGEQVVGSVGVFTDLREKMRMEQRLQKAQEQILQQERQAVIAELAGAAAHELNQPLTSVMGYAELLKRRLDVGSAVYGAAEVIYAEAERMAEIVRKIGRITKYETKSYVGGARILDIDKASDEPHLSSTRGEQP